MEFRPDASGSASDRLQDQQWSFLQGDPPNASNVQYTHSHPPSSYEYLRSDRSIVSPLTISLSHIGGNTSLSHPSSRNRYSASSGARSTTSTPVLLCINSANSHSHTNPAPRRNRRPVEIVPETGLPALKDFSMQGILLAIQEDIEGDLNTISEILGRSRFVLADQHESHMPPQGEITGSRVHSPLQGIDETMFGTDVSAFDNVMIAHEDASLIDGSNSGSAAYGLLERLQIAPRTAVVRPSNELLAVVSTVSNPPEISSDYSDVLSAQTPVADRPIVTTVEVEAVPVSIRRGLSQIERGPSQPVVSETFLDAEADGIASGNIPIVAEAGRYYPLYDYDDTGIFDATSISARPPVTVTDVQTNTATTFSAFSSWFSSPRANTNQRIETRLRSLLNR